MRLIIWLLEPAYRALWAHMVRSGLILQCSDAPDTSGINAAAVQNAEIGREQLALAREQMAKNDVRQAEYDPLFKKLIQSSIDSQKTANDQSAEQWKSYKDTWQPIEKKLADTAANYDTPERRAAEAEAAAADVGTQFGAQRQALTRDIGRAGMSLTGGKALALAAGSRMDEAKAAAGATSNAHRQVEQAGISLVDNAARFGRNMTSTGLQTAQLALSAGNNAGNTIGQQQSTINSGLAGAQGFYQGAVGAGNSAGGLLSNVAQIQQANTQANQQMLGSLVGAGATTAMLKSSSTTKDVEGDVDPDAALKSVVDTPVKAWRYKDGDRRLRLGPMAEDVAASTGIGDGMALDIATELGTLRAAVQALAKDKTKGSTKQLALSGD